MYLTFHPLKGLVHPKKEYSVINYPLVVPNLLDLVRLRNTIKIFFMKSENFLTLYRQQQNYPVQGPER